MANTTLGTLSTIVAASIAETDRFLIRDISANTDFATTLSELRLALGSQPVVILTSSTSDALRVTQTGTGAALRIEDAANPDVSPFLIDNAGNIISGYTTLVSTVGASNTAIIPKFQYHDTGTYGSALSTSMWSNNAGLSGQFIFNKSSNNTIGVHKLVPSTTDVGAIVFNASDGVKFVNVGQIIAETEGTTALDSMPGRLMFFTTSSGANTTTERMRINSAGNVGVGTTSPTSIMHINTTSANTFYRATSNSGVLLAGVKTDATAYVSSEANYPLVIATNSTERFRVHANGDIATTGKMTVGSDLTINGVLNSAATTFALINAANTVTAFNAARSLTLGYTGTNSVTVNFVTGATASGQTKTINIGTGGNVSSATSIVLGSQQGGAVTIASSLLSYPNAPVTTSAATYYYMETSGSAGLIQRKSLANTVSEIVTNASVATAMGIASSSLVTLTDSQALTNKTFDKLTDSIAASYVNIVTTAVLNFTASSTLKVTPTGNVTVTATVPAAGTIARLLVLTSGVTSYTITFSTGFKVTGTLATGTVTAKYFAMTFISDGTQLIETSRTAAM